MTIKNVGVIGCGLMGSGIVQVSAQAGFQVLFVEANDDLVKRGLSRLRETLEGLASRGKLDAKAKDVALERIAGTTRLEDLKACDLVVEAMTENQALKNETFAKLHKICAPHAILASNTSSCNVTAMAAATGRPAQVLGLHFFNPLPVPYLLDAIRVYESGLSSLEDIDAAMKLGCGYPMGPFTLLDLVGLDTTMYVAEVMFEEFREPRYAPPPLLKRMVMAGQLGRKTKQGFYRYSTT